jgi:hypothetical protein
MISLILIYILDMIISQKMIVGNKKIEYFTNEAPGTLPSPVFQRGRRFGQARYAGERPITGKVLPALEKFSVPEYTIRHPSGNSVYIGRPRY